MNCNACGKPKECIIGSLWLCPDRCEESAAEPQEEGLTWESLSPHCWAAKSPPLDFWISKKVDSTYVASVHERCPSGNSTFLCSQDFPTMDEAQEWCQMLHEVQKQFLAR